MGIAADEPPPGPDAPDDTETPSRGTLKVVVRILVSIALLGLLIWQLPTFDPARLLPHLRPSTVVWLVLSGAALLVAFALQTLRWAEVLAALGHRLPFRRLFTQFLAGQFVSNVLPTAFGGDVIRVARLGRDIDDRPVAFASIALERLTGWLVLPVISVAAMAVTPSTRGLGAPTATALTIDIVTLVALGAVLVVAALPRWTDAARSATGWRRWIGSVHLGVDRLRRDPRHTLGVLAAGAAFQITQCVSVWLAARALEIPQVTLAATFAFFPPTAIGQNLPTGFAGLGVREAGFVLFFGALGATHERCIALGLVGYLLMVAVSALGAPAFAVGNRRPHPVGPFEGEHELESALDELAAPEGRS